MEQGDIMRRASVDREHFSKERILSSQEFIAAFSGYLNYYCGVNPEREHELREYFTEDRLIQIQKIHQYTNVDIAESFGATA